MTCAALVLEQVDARLVGQALALLVDAQRDLAHGSEVRVRARRQSQPEEAIPQ